MCAGSSCPTVTPTTHGEDEFRWVSAHTAGKSAHCQPRGKQSCSPAWQSWGTGCSPRPPSIATHLLVGDRQARHPHFSWQERQSKVRSCFVSGSQNTSQEKGQSSGSQTGHVHMAYSQLPKHSLGTESRKGPGSL